MAATTCAYGYESCRPAATTAAMGAPTPARSSQIMEPFNDDDGRGDAAHGYIQGAVMPPPPAPPPPPLPPPLDLHLGARNNPSKPAPRHLGLCTEGLGSESSGDVDLGDVADDTDKDAGADVGQALPSKRHHGDGEEEKAMSVLMPMPARTRSGRALPPPISVIGAGGKPWLYLRAHRGDGRLVLREMMIPSRELLQACREDGRLKLHFAHPEEEQLEDCQGQEQEIKN